MVDTRKGLNGLETLIGEAARERRSRMARGPDPAPLLRTLLRLRHDVVMLRRAAGAPWHDAVRGQLAQPWADAVQAGAGRLQELGDALAGQRAPSRAETIAEGLGTYRVALDAVRRQGLTRLLDVDEVGRLFGIGFALDQLRRDLADLAERAQELAAGHDQGIGR